VPVVSIQIDHHDVGATTHGAIVGGVRPDDPEPGAAGRRPERSDQALMVIDHGDAEAFVHPNRASARGRPFLNAYDSLEE
jgi:hypothetical protein